MHSRQSNKPRELFWQEFERVLENARQGPADFSHFVFPETQLADQAFDAECWFFKTTFTEVANFSKAIFKKGAVFLAEFEGDTLFTDAWFMDSANFEGAVFSQDDLPPINSAS